MGQSYDNTHPAARRTSDRDKHVRDGGSGTYGYLFLEELEAPEVRGLTPRALRVLLALWAMSKKGTDRCWPSQIRLAQITGLSRPRVSHATRELQEAGLIEKITGEREGLTYRVLRPPSLRQSAARTMAAAAK